MATQVFEGTWEEILLRADEFAGKRVEVTILSDVRLEQTGPPNEGMLAALRDIAKLQEGMRETSGADTQQLLRQARGGD